MKFIRKNGRIIPIKEKGEKGPSTKDKIKTINKAYYDKKLSDSDIEKNTVYRKATGKERINTAKGLGVVFGVLGAGIGGLIGAGDSSNAGKSMKHIAKSAGKSALAVGAIGMGMGALMGGLSWKRIDNKKTDNKLYNFVKNRKKKGSSV